MKFLEADYHTPYLRLFNRMTDAIAALDDGRALAARELLIAAQREAEESYLSQDSESGEA